MSPANAARQLFHTFRESRTRRNLYSRIRDFNPKLSCSYETEDYIVKTADSPAELLKGLQLRHQVFVEEWQGKTLPLGLDVDDYDFEGDHLLIIDRASFQVIGTYRLLCSRFTRNFYSSSEFEISDFLAQPGIKLELGRACIRADRRDGNSIDLLWKGLARYIEQSGARFVFGCASVMCTDAEKISAFYRDLRVKEYWSDLHHIRSTRDYLLENFDLHSNLELDRSEMKELMPALLRSYLHAGAKVYGYPAHDREFNCVDVLTVLDVLRLNPRFKQRFFGRS